MESSPIPRSTPDLVMPPDNIEGSGGRPASPGTGAGPGDEAQDGTPVAGPSTPPPAAPVPKRPARRAPRPKAEHSTAYTTAWVPGLFNIKNPAGDYLQRESNVDVFRQVSVARARREKEELETERQKVAEGESAEQQEEDKPEETNPLTNILVIHPGSRNLRIGRASDFYPHEIPNCIARPSSAVNRGRDPPVLGSRAKRIAQEHLEKRDPKKKKEVNGAANGGDDAEGNWVDPVDQGIGYARDYLREKLRANRLQTDWREGSRVKAANNRVKPEPIPEHNDPYRIEWTETESKNYFIGEEALRLPPDSGFKVRYPILRRGLNRRDWTNHQLLLDDIGTIIEDALRKEMNITPKDYHKFSVVFIVPDHGDRFYVQEMTALFLGVMGFKEIAVHQEAYAAIFAAGMSTACVVDIGAEVTSVTCVDEGNLISDTRVNLAYGGDDITSALVNLLQRSSFPYRDLDLGRPQEWRMMDNLKMKICTLEEHLVANTPWDFYVLKPQGMTDKYVFRTYDENILAPLCFFDTRMIDFEEKEDNGLLQPWIRPALVDDELLSSYGEPTGAMRSCTNHLRPAPPTVAEVLAVANGSPERSDVTPANGSPVKPSGSQDADPVVKGSDTPSVQVETNGIATATQEGTESEVLQQESEEPLIEYNIVEEASKVPLDAALAASIALAGATENKIKAAAASILLIGGSSALKGLGAFIADRLPSLLRARHLPIQDVSIVPPPRGLNPRFVSWKGACVMCNLESLSDMWVRRDEWEAIQARALKDRYLFL